MLKVLNYNLSNILRELSLKSDIASKHSAMIIRGGNKIISCGYNNGRTCMSGHPICAQHAETNAILNMLSEHSARSTLKMKRDGQWCFLRGPSIKKKDKKIYIDSCSSKQGG